jgi:hypothetical protein
MTVTYALTVQIESYGYYGEFYLIGEGYDTPADVLEHVAADHLLRISNESGIEQYLLDVLQEGANASSDEYDSIDADVECWIHVDVYYRRYSFGAGDTLIEIEDEPTRSRLESIADDLRS